jgi:serine/threonine protein kinase
MHPTEESKFHVAITDFGVAQVVDENLMRVRMMKKSEIFGASLNYAAPEILLSIDNAPLNIPDPTYGKLVDVYSYAMTVFELFAKQKPWAGLPSVEIKALVTNEQRPQLNNEAQKRVSTGKRSKKLLEIMMDCWEHSVQKRPQMSAIQTIFLS